VTALLALQVPSPTLGFTPIRGTFAPLERAVAVAFAAIRVPDGSAMTPEDYAGAQALVSRIAVAGGAPEVWDPAIKRWRAAAGVDLNQLGGVPLVPPTTGTAPWQGLLLGSAEKDATGAPQIQAAVAHFPQYWLRGAFHAKRGAIEARGVGPESGPIEFASGAATARFGAELTPDADGATRVRIVLRDGAANPVGVIDIDASGGSPVVTIANRGSGGAPLASLKLEADGAIALRPLSGKRVVISGDLETEHVRYLPVGGISKTDL
jgi:hypothetical protein